MIVMDWLCVCVSYFFFFKQKTAYEMRISDWSSDVCSSDLPEMRLSGAVIGYANAAIIAGTAYGSEASGIRAATAAEFSNRDAFVLTNGSGTKDRKSVV